MQTSLHGGRLELIWPDLASTGALQAFVLAANGVEHTSEGWRQAAGDMAAFTTICGPAAVRVRIRSIGARARVDLELTARASLEAVEIGLLAEPTLDERSPAWLVYSGYQSWDASGVARLVPGGKEPLQSWWTIGLAGDAGRGLALSALSARAASTRFDAAPNRLSIGAVEPTGIQLRPVLWRARRGESWRSDPLVITADEDVQSALRRAAGQVRGRRVQAVPQGWLSWYHYGPWVAHADVLENAAAMRDGALAGLGYDVVQVDDGWQQLYGDWTPNEKFPGGLAALAATCREQGQRLGVWTAPFLVSATSELARSAPDDWFVADPTTGERATDPIHLVFGPMHVLDARNRAVRKHLEDTFSRLRADGVTYFKIDFLYAGGYAGTKALRQGLQAIRKGAGDDAYVLACGAPLLPAVGICDGCRIGRDTATPIFDFELGGPKPTLIDDEIADVARNMAARHHLDSWFHLDPDVALVGGNLTLEQAYSCVTFCALSGGPFFASDDLDALPPERLSILLNRRVLDLVGGPVARPDWRPDGYDRASAVWRTDDTIAVFNWDGELRTITVENVPDAPLTDLWTGEDMGRSHGRIRVIVPPSGVRLIGLGPG